MHEDGIGLSPRARAYAVLVTVGFALLVLSARGLPPDERGFPLSVYPMFAQKRPANERLPYAEAVLADGSRRRLGISWWTTGGVSYGRNQLDALARVTADQRATFCADIARKVAASDEDWAAKTTEVRIVAGLFLRDRFVRSGDLRPVRADTIVACPVAAEAP